MFVHIRAGLVSGDVVVGGCYRIREREDECRGDVRCAHCVVVEGVEGAEDVCLERFFGFSTVETVNDITIVFILCICPYVHLWQIHPECDCP